MHCRTAESGIHQAHQACRKPPPGTKRPATPREAFTHTGSTVRTTRTGTASSAPAVQPAPRCMLRATPCQGTKAPGHSLTALSRVEKEGSCTRVALQLGMGGRHSRRARGCGQEGRSGALQSPGRAGGCRQILYIYIYMYIYESGGLLQRCLPYRSSVLLETPNPCNLYLSPHNLAETGQQTELLERGAHGRRHAQAWFLSKIGL